MVSKLSDIFWFIGLSRSSTIIKIAKLPSYIIRRWSVYWYIYFIVNHKILNTWKYGIASSAISMKSFVFQAAKEGTDSDRSVNPWTAQRTAYRTATRQGSPWIPDLTFGGINPTMTWLWVLQLTWHQLTLPYYVYRVYLIINYSILNWFDQK